MAKAIETGILKLRIEEAAAKKQARIDSGKDHIIGFNLFPYTEDKEIDILDVDNQKVRLSQIEKLKKIKFIRDSTKVESCLNALENAARNNSGNLLELSIKCAEARCNFGRNIKCIRKSLQKIYG